MDRALGSGADSDGIAPLRRRGGVGEVKNEK